MKLLVHGSQNITRRVFSTLNNMLASKSSLENFGNSKEIENEFEVEEVKIPISSGYLAGKWWGNKSERPFLCIHGWQDNAGSFDRLIPLLPRNHSYLAIDLPGHGFSSRLPDGMQYHGIDNLRHIHDLLHEYEWDKVSIIGHSMGAGLGFLFASTFPKNVDMLIGIDGLKPPSYEPTSVVRLLESRIKNFVLADKRNRENTEPPSYSIDEMSEKLSKATRGSIPKELAPYLLRRNVRKSEKFVEKYYFSRDSRLKYMMDGSFFQNVSVELAKKINMPYLYLKAAQSFYFERKEYHDEIVNILKEHNQDFSFHTIDSTHHMHLTEPEKVSQITCEFINKHKN